TNFGRPALRRHVGGRKTSRAALRGGRRAGLANRGCRGRSGGRCHGVGLPAVAAHSLIGSRFADYHSSTISRIGIICLRISGRSVSPTYCQEFRTAPSKSSVVTGSKPYRAKKGAACIVKRYTRFAPCSRAYSRPVRTR